MFIKKSLSILLLLLVIITLSQCQENGFFWWKNKDLVNGAAQSRSLKESSAKIRTLPPKYRHEESESTTKKPISIYDRDVEDDEDEKNHAEYKYDNEPDCVCVPKNLCSANNTLITDGNGLIDER